VSRGAGRGKQSRNNFVEKDEEVSRGGAEHLEMNKRVIEVSTFLTNLFPLRVLASP